MKRRDLRYILFVLLYTRVACTVLITGREGMPPPLGKQAFKKKSNKHPERQS
jgi:hypothetical protein